MIKFSVVLSLHFFGIIALAQGNDTSYSIRFHSKFNTEDIHRDTLKKTFILNGDSSQIYSIKIINDSTTLLSKFYNNKSYFIDTLSHLFVSEFSGEIIIPGFTITDFDKDGDQDLLCFLFTNIHGNIWTAIFLFDEKNKTLVKLIDPGDSDDIWDAPEFNGTTNGIKCKRISGVYGISYESSYYLDGLIAYPLDKREEDTSQLNSATGKGGVIRLYTGKSGRWELVCEQNME